VTVERAGLHPPSSDVRILSISSCGYCSVDLIFWYPENLLRGSSGLTSFRPRTSSTEDEECHSSRLKYVLAYLSCKAVIEMRGVPVGW